MSNSIDTPEYNKAFIKAHFEEFVNRKNHAVAMINFSEDFLDHDEAGGPAIGPEKAMHMMAAMHKMLPDLHVQIEDIIAEGDKVMVRNIWNATNPNGVKIQFKGFVLWRLKNGKIVERWAALTQPSQLTGKLPAW